MGVASKMYPRFTLCLVQVGGVGHGEPGHVVVLPVHPCLLSERSHGWDRFTVNLQLLDSGKKHT